MASALRDVRASFAAVLGAVLGLYGWSSASQGPSPSGAARSPSRAAATALEPPAPRAPATISATQLDGRAFPDHAIALTWDDGPDAHTLALATYLHDRRISGTFFVVGEWSPSISCDPGWGSGVFETGYDHLPVLGDLIRLGHRLGNHTRHHATLTGLGPDGLDDEVAGNQARLDPFLADELRLLRAPGGAWSADAARALAREAYTAGIVGPVRWDVDRKDWDGSASCVSDRPAVECEASSIEGRMQTKPSVIAGRYLESIEAAGRGIVLLHDRVGQVGSTYAIEVARALIPALEQRGYVFVAPVLAFSPLSPRESDPKPRGPEPVVGLADVDGDGRADLCRREWGKVVCAPSIEGAPTFDAPTPHSAFEEAPPADPALDAAAWSALAPSASLALGDVNGDGRADVCGPGSKGSKGSKGGKGIVCALATGDGRFSAPEPWSSAPEHSDEVLLGDLDGDGVSDVCARVDQDIRCALSLRAGFAEVRSWAALPWPASTSRALVDVDGDGRVDLCAASPGGVVCGLSRAGSFGSLALWSTRGDFATTAEARTTRFGDLNGDGRADACTWDGSAVLCALSTGAHLTRATPWTGVVTAALAPAGFGAIHLADINGDGRADLCAETAETLTIRGAGVACGVAP